LGERYEGGEERRENVASLLYTTRRGNNFRLIEGTGNEYRGLNPWGGEGRAAGYYINYVQNFED